MFDMDIMQIPLFAMLRGRMGYLTERQELIAENVANADTPGFLPKDLKPFSFQAQMAAMTQASSTAPAATEPGHMQPARLQSQAGGVSGYNPTVSRDSETKLDGNSVVLEEEMMKLSDARMNYDAAVTFYQKSLSLLRTAAKAPGK